MLLCPLLQQSNEEPRLQTRCLAWGHPNVIRLGELRNIPNMSSNQSGQAIGNTDLAKLCPLKSCHKPMFRLMTEPRTHPRWVNWTQPSCPEEEEGYAQAYRLCQLLPLPGSKSWSVLFNSIGTALDSLQPTLCVLPLHYLHAKHTGAA